MRIIFLGTCLPLDQCSENMSCSEAANNFQFNLLFNLAKSSHVKSLIVSTLTPMASFPRNKKLIFPGYVLNNFFQGVQLICVPFINFEPLKTISAFISFFLYTSKELYSGCDVLLVYNLNPSFASAATLLGKFFSKPVAIIVADIPVPSSLNSASFLRKVDAWLQRFLMRHADGLIVLSTPMATDFAPNSKYLHMEGGISDHLKTLPPISIDHATASKKVILYSGTLGVNGGLQLLLDAFALIHDNTYELWITGRGSLEMEILKPLKKDSRIHYWGFVDRKKLMSLYQKASILINPRRSCPENRYAFPSKLIEYLAFGRPVISTATPDVENIYGDHLYILDKETPEDLSKLIVEVGSLSKDELDDIGLQGRKFVLENKLWSCQSQKILNFISQLESIRFPK